MSTPTIGNPSPLRSFDAEVDTRIGEGRRWIFISYSHLDREYVDRLAKHLAAVGVPCWYDYRIGTGERFDKAIAQQIDACAAFVIVMTPASFNSEWVANEIDYARDTRKPIFPLLLSGERFISLRTRRYENVSQGQMPSSRFIDELRAVVGAKPLSGTLNVNDPTAPGA